LDHVGDFIVVEIAKMEMENLGKYPKIHMSSEEGV
jgi:hypothetical protein